MMVHFYDLLIGLLLHFMTAMGKPCESWLSWCDQLFAWFPIYKNFKHFSSCYIRMLKAQREFFPSSIQLLCKPALDNQKGIAAHNMGATTTMSICTLWQRLSSLELYTINIKLCLLPEKYLAAGISVLALNLDTTVDWLGESRLKLNPSEIEIMWLGWPALHALHGILLSVVNSIRNLGE